jgi:quercetin dioxygenase-like cupin family protein
VTSEEDPFEHLGVRTYVAEPGEQLPSVYHYNENQEEAFYVLSGTLNVETPEEIYEVDAGTFFLVDAGHPHRAFNPEDAAEAVHVLAMGAPTDDRGIPYEP